MRRFWHSFFRSVARVYPRCVTQAQAIAFNMFLAFFPMLLLGLGAVGGSARLRAGVKEIAGGLGSILPPGSRELVVDFLTRDTAHPWRWTFFGVVATLLVGTQVMRLLMDGFQLAHRDDVRPAFWERQGRAVLLLAVTFVPWLATAIFSVFGRQLRAWMIHHYGLRALMRQLWIVVFSGTAVAIAIIVLAVVYRLGRPGRRAWREVLPGAVVATLLWWGANSAFGYYVRHVPKELVYSGLAAAIGLMLWMYLTAMIILLGAAFNAEFSAGSPSTVH